MENTPIISIQNLTKTFGKKKVLHNINLSINEGEKIAIIGTSGCGKSTLLRLLLGLIEPDNGHIYFKGQNIADLSEKEKRYWRIQMGMLFQSSALFDSMTVAENIGFSLLENFNYSKHKIKNRVNELLTLIDMEGYGDEMPSSLSGGQKKRVGLARAIASEPALLLYDEPTTGLDPILSTSIEDLIVKLSDEYKITSIIVSHQLSTILRTVDHIYMLHNGELLEPETPKSIAKTKNLMIREFIRGGLQH